MQTIEQLIHAKWVITGEPNQAALPNHSLVIDKGIIKEIISTELAKERYTAKTSETFSSHAIMPGFVNTHTHIGMNLMRGIADDLSLMDWLHNHIWPEEKKWVSSEFVYDSSLLAMAEMIRGGTTCYNEMYFFPEETAKATEQAGIYGNIGITIIEFPTNWANTPEEAFAKGLAFYDRYKNHPTIKTTFAPHAPYTVSDHLLMRIKELAEINQLKINLHLQETADEVKQSLEKFKKRPTKRLYDLNFLSKDIIAIHVTQTNEEDLTIFAETKPSIVHCPESNMKLASGVCPIEQLKKRGINVALGTDGVASNNDLDMIGEMRAAAFLAKLSTNNPTSLTAEETITMATLHGAKAVGLDHITGSLKANKSADFIAINLEEIETLPLFNPIAQIVYAAGRNQVTDVWVKGKRLLKNRELLTLDEKTIKEKTKIWQDRLRK